MTLTPDPDFATQVLLGKCDLRKVSSHLPAENKQSRYLRRELNVEEEYNVEKSLKSCKSPLQKKKSCNKNQEKAIFFVLTKMIILINIHMGIKPMQ